MGVRFPGKHQYVDVILSAVTSSPAAPSRPPINVPLIINNELSYERYDVSCNQNSSDLPGNDVEKFITG